MVYFADMFLICFGSSSTYSTIPLVANHPTTSFWALSHVVLASMQGQQDQEKIFSAQLSYQLRRHCPPKHGMLWPSAGPFGTVISCHLEGETIEPSAMYIPLRCISSSLFQTMPIFLHAQIAGNKKPLRVYHCIFHSELQILFPLYIFQKRNCYIKSWHVEMRNYYLTKKEILKFLTQEFHSFDFWGNPTCNPSTKKRGFKTNASASRFRLPDSPLTVCTCLWTVKWNGGEKRRCRMKKEEVRVERSLLVSTKHETGRWLEKEIAVLETIFFSGSMLFFRGADDAALYDEIHYQHHPCHQNQFRSKIERLPATFVFWWFDFSIWMLPHISTRLFWPW